MKLKNIFILIFCLSVFSAKSQEKDSVLISKDSIPYLNTAFQPGEQLLYKVKYGLIPGGYAKMTIDTEEIGYGWYYAVSAIAHTTGLVSKFANVWDKYETFIDIATGLPIRATRNIKENKYRKFNELIFNRNANKVSSLNTGEHKIPPGTMDILSAFYFARRHIFKKEMTKNDVINITTFFDEELFIVKIRYKKTEKIRTAFGRIKCLKFVPVIEKGGPFKKEKQLQVWFSDDGNFIPVKIRLKLGVGKLKCDLKEYKGLKNPFGKPYTRKNN